MANSVNNSLVRWGGSQQPRDEGRSRFIQESASHSSLTTTFIFRGLSNGCLSSRENQKQLEASNEAVSNMSRDFAETTKNIKDQVSEFNGFLTKLRDKTTDIGFNSLDRFAKTGSYLQQEDADHITNVSLFAKEMLHLQTELIETAFKVIDRLDQRNCSLTKEAVALAFETRRQELEQFGKTLDMLRTNETANLHNHIALQKAKHEMENEKMKTWLNQLKATEELKANASAQQHTQNLQQQAQIHAQNMDQQELNLENQKAESAQQHTQNLQQQAQIHAQNIDQEKFNLEKEKAKDDQKARASEQQHTQNLQQQQQTYNHENKKRKIEWKKTEGEQKFNLQTQRQNHEQALNMQKTANEAAREKQQIETNANTERFKATTKLAESIMQPPKPCIVM